MKQRIIILFSVLMMAFSPSEMIADEGMWMVHMFESIYPQMVKTGLKLKPNEIYNQNANHTVSDAIVSLDFGCTGSMISKNGLMITNHHCAYGDIHSLSTPENNYLDNGFWAMNRSDEKHIKGKNAFFLRKVLDVTDQVNQCIEQVKKTGFKGMVMRRVYKQVESKYQKSTPYEVMCASVWSGTKYYMFFYEMYPDVRLVGAPPASIGAFGGETDNWGWPQHKGDFAIYRIYTGKDGKPAAYSNDNVPMVPAKVLNISAAGVKEGDYAMVMGYPAKTNRYISSFEVKQKQEIINPIVIQARRGKLDVWKKHMDQSPAIRLMYADKYFGISNYADYAKWENQCFKMYNVIGIREAEEREFTGEDQQLLAHMKKGFEAKNELVRYKTWFKEIVVSASECVANSKRVTGIIRHMEKGKIDSVSLKNPLVKKALKMSGNYFKTFDLETDLDLFKFNLDLMIKNMPQEYYSDTLKNWIKQFGGSANQLADFIYDNSNFTTPEKIRAFFATPKSIADIRNDVMYKFTEACCLDTFKDLEEKVCKKVGFDPDSYKSKYTRVLYNMRETKGIPQSPDANSTMRLSYGTVGGVEPYDGVKYAFQTTIKGYTEKENPDEYEFKVTDRMKSLIASKEWGRWAEKGVMYVNFLTNNDITGGNSGSPVLNGKGEIIGLAFDGNRESISGDAYYHPTNFKTVCVDIRFVLWVIEKYAGASLLIDEMNIVK
ncbi:MAG: S46 family peptidase [Bacteroidales bacterium]